MKEAATHQFELHDAHAVPEDVGGCPQQLGESIQCVVFEGRTSNLERRQNGICTNEWPSRLSYTLIEKSFN